MAKINMYVKRNSKRKSFSRIKQSKAEVFFMIYGIASLVAWGLLLYLTYRSSGEVNHYFSSMELLIYIGTMITLTGAIVKATKLHTIRFLPTLSLVANVLAVLGWTGVYFIGLFVL